MKEEAILTCGFFCADFDCGVFRPVRGLVLGCTLTVDSFLIWGFCFGAFLFEPFC